MYFFFVAAKEWTERENTGSANFTLEEISGFCQDVCVCYHFEVEGVSKVRDST